MSDQTQLPGSGDSVATYQEPYRPQLHFSPAIMWMNDPNGLVYYAGEYHLFYQFHPDSMVHGPMHWGHAVSPDLVHWQHLPIAIYPNEQGTIWSGSAVIDWTNSSGLQSGDEPPLIAIFTHTLAGADDQKQSIAYSHDRGRTFTMYEGNPVIPNFGIRDFRDPKVFWHQPSSQWVMIVVRGDRALFYQSPDLKAWTQVGEFGADEGNHEGVWECPDLFELPVENRPGETKWVMIISIGKGAPNGGTGTQYFVGDFDGRTFTNQHPPDTALWIDYGRDNYAAVTYSDIPAEDGRRLLIGWMSNWQYARQTPTSPWRSAMTLPRELALTELPSGEYRLISRPTVEIMKLREQSLVVEAQPLADLMTVKIADSLLQKGHFEVEVEFNPGAAAEVGLILKNEAGDEVKIGYQVVEQQLLVDRRRSGVVDFSDTFSSVSVAPLELTDERLRLRLFVDTSSIELFANNGLIVITDQIFPTSPLHQLGFYAQGGEAHLTGGAIYALSSIWHD
jgi:fructan beta-fructosidase